MKKFSVFMMIALLSFSIPVFGGQSSNPLLKAASFPSAAEILALGDFQATHRLLDKVRESAVNHSFLHAARAWMRHDYKEAKRMFREHVEIYPDSPWVSEAYLHLGFDAINNMRFTEAGEAFSWVIEQNRESGTKESNLLMNRAKMGLGNVKMN